MDWIKRLLNLATKAPATPAGQEQALLIRLDGGALPGAAHIVDEVAALEDELDAALGGIGELDGHDIGMGEAIIYLYGNDAEAMFRAVESILRAHTLAVGATAILRFGPPGAAERRYAIAS